MQDNENLKRKFRLNKNAFVRHYNEYVYIEHQISHQRAWLTNQHFYWLKEGDYDIEYESPELPLQAVALLDEMDKRWFIDFTHGETLQQREFTYANKSRLEMEFDNMSALIEDGIITTEKHIRNLQIELTDMCNERCVHCYLPNSKKDKSLALDFATVERVLRQYRAYGGLKVIFSGGEILLHKQLRQILELCRELNLMILLQTNLLALTQNEIIWLKEIGVFNIQVSLYSTNREIHDSITTLTGSHDITFRNIKLLRDHNIPMMISCPVMNWNLSTVKELKNIADSLNINIYFDITMMAQCDGDSQNLLTRINLSDIYDILKFMLETDKYLMNQIREAESEEDLLSKMFARRKLMCDILSNTLCIDSNGNYYPCPGWNGMVLGNIASSSISDIWNSDKANILRTTQKTCFEKCRHCNLQNFCDMCAVYNFNENGDMSNICNRFCESAKILRECVLEVFRNETEKLDS